MAPLFFALAAAAEPCRPLLELTVGEAIRLDLPRNPSAAAVTDTQIAGVFGGMANVIEVQAFRPGTTDLVFQFGPGVPPIAIDLSVGPDLRALERMIGRIVPPEPAPAPSPGPHVPVTPKPVSLRVGDTLLLDIDRPHVHVREVTAQPTDPSVVTAEVRGSEIVLTGREVGWSQVMVVVHAGVALSYATLMTVTVVPTDPITGPSTPGG